MSPKWVLPEPLSLRKLKLVSSNCTTSTSQQNHFCNMFLVQHPAITKDKWARLLRVQLHSCMIQIVSCEYTLTRDILGWSSQAYSYMYKHTSSSHLLYKTVWGVGVAIQKKWSSIIDSIRICLAYFELWAHRSLYHELASTFRNIQWENLDTCATDWRRRNVSLPVQTRWWLSSKTIIIASTERWPVCWFRPEADLLTYCSY